MQRTVVSNIAWRFAEQVGAQGVTFIVSIVLARILAPEDFGLITLITVFTTIMMVFVNSGLANALIQKKDADDTDFSSVFYFNIAASLVLYGIMFFSAPWIASFYNEPKIVPIIRVLSLTLAASGLKVVQQAYVSRNMLFKRFFYATIGGTVVSAIIGITMALKGYGVWALALQQLSKMVVDTLILWLTVRWRPRLVYSWSRLKGLLSYGWKLLASSLLDTLYNNMRSLVIGKMYSPGDLAFYNKGMQFPFLFVTNVNAAFDSVLFPVMSKVQDSKAHVKSVTRRAIKTSTYIMAPLMFGLLAAAKPLVILLLTEKWLPCVPYMQIFSITFLFYPLHTANLNAIKGIGRSDLMLKLELIKKGYGVALLLATMWFGPLAMAYSLLVSSVLSQIVNTWPNRKLLNYGYKEQLRDLAPELLLGFFMGLCIVWVPYVGLSNWLTLAIQILLGATVYIGGSTVLKYESFRYIKDMMRNSFLKQKEVTE